MGNDDAKRLILARRARFVAAAVASAGLAGLMTGCPQTCLTIPADRATNLEAGRDADGGDATDAALDSNEDEDATVDGDQ